MITHLLYKTSPENTRKDLQEETREGDGLVPSPSHSYASSALVGVLVLLLILIGVLLLVLVLLLHVSASFPLFCYADSFPRGGKLYTARKNPQRGRKMEKFLLHGIFPQIIVDKRRRRWYHTYAKQRRTAASVLTFSASEKVNDRKSAWALCVCCTGAAWLRSFLFGQII